MNEIFMIMNVKNILPRRAVLPVKIDVRAAPFRATPRRAADRCPRRHTKPRRAVFF